MLYVFWFLCVVVLEFFKEVGEVNRGVNLDSWFHLPLVAACGLFAVVGCMPIGGTSLAERSFVAF